MRRTLLSWLTLATITCQVLTASGQTSARFGVKAGVNVATTNEPNSSSVVGFVGGGFLTLSLTDMIAVQPELLFTMKGRKAVETVQNFGIIHSEVRLNYIELPVLAKLNILRGGNIAPHLFAGPFFSIFLESFKSTDFGLSVGGGVDFDLAQLKITVDARYSHSLKDAMTITTWVSDGSGNRVYENSRAVKNRVLSLVVGICF